MKKSIVIAIVSLAIFSIIALTSGCQPKAQSNQPTSEQLDSLGMK